MTNKETLDFINANRGLLTLKSLEDAKIGDYVFVYRSDGRTHGDYEVKRVTKTTATQIIIVDTRYRRDSGKSIGEYQKSIIYAPLAPARWDKNLIEIDTIVQSLMVWNEKDEKREPIRKIKNSFSISASGFSLDTLIAIWALIEKEIDDSSSEEG